MQHGKTTKKQVGQRGWQNDQIATRGKAREQAKGQHNNETKVGKTARRKGTSVTAKGARGHKQNQTKGKGKSCEGKALGKQGGKSRKDNRPRGRVAKTSRCY